MEEEKRKFAIIRLLICLSDTWVCLVSACTLSCMNFIMQ